MRFNIKTKLAVGFGAVLLFAGAAGGLGYTRLSSTREDMRESDRLTHMSDLAQRSVRRRSSGGP